MEQMIFATGNAGKMREIRMILAGMKIKEEPVDILSMKEAGIDVAICENGDTFVENAVIKAKAVANIAKGKIILADDSGLEIDYLNKEPGIYSARYMGENTSYHMKNQNLLERLKDVPWENRTARFVCAIAAVLPDDTVLTQRATVEGYIYYEEKGENGFGYDPIFFVPDFEKTTAELSDDEKNEISHRGKALSAMRTQLEMFYGA